MSLILVRKADRPDWLPKFPPARDVKEGETEPAAYNRDKNIEGTRGARQYGDYMDPFVDRHSGAEIHHHTFKARIKKRKKPEKQPEGEKFEPPADYRTDKSYHEDGMRLSKVLGRWMGGDPEKHPELGVHHLADMLDLPEIVPAWKAYQDTQQKIQPLSKLQRDTLDGWTKQEDMYRNALLDMDKSGSGYATVMRQWRKERDEMDKFHDSPEMQELDKLRSIGGSQRMETINHVMGRIQPDAKAWLETMGLKPHDNADPYSIEEFAGSGPSGGWNPKSLELNMQAQEFGTRFGQRLGEGRDLQSTEHVVDTSERARGGRTKDRKALWQAGLGRRLRTDEANVAAGERAQASGQAGLEERAAEEAPEEEEEALTWLAGGKTKPRESAVGTGEVVPGSIEDVYSRNYRGDTVFTEGEEHHGGRIRPPREVGAKFGGGSRSVSDEAAQAGGGSSLTNVEEAQASAARREHDAFRHKKAREIETSRRDHLRDYDDRAGAGAAIAQAYDDHLAQQPEEGEVDEKGKKVKPFATDYFDANGMPDEETTQELNQDNLWSFMPEHFPVTGGREEAFDAEGHPTPTLMSEIDEHNLKPLLPTLFPPEDAGDGTAVGPSVPAEHEGTIEQFRQLQEGEVEEEAPAPTSEAKPQRQGPDMRSLRERLRDDGTDDDDAMQLAAQGTTLGERLLKAILDDMHHRRG